MAMNRAWPMLLLKRTSNAIQIGWTLLTFSGQIHRESRRVLVEVGFCPFFLRASTKSDFFFFISIHKSIFSSSSLLQDSHHYDELAQAPFN